MLRRGLGPDQMRHRRMRSRRGWLASCVIALSYIAAGSSIAATLSRAEREAAARRVESVYWEHRIWPDVNPQPKPRLELQLPDTQIRARVEDSLRKSAALDVYWRRPITADQLQAELNRMARTTRDPDRLLELFHSLGDDAGLISEVLVRPILADRLLREWYWADPRFHADVRAQAERFSHSARRFTDIGSPAFGGVLTELRYKHVKAPAERHDSASLLARAGGPVAVEVGDSEWSALQAQALALGVSPTGFGPLVENSASFSVSRILQVTQDELSISTRSWQKRSFDAWWEEQARLIAIVEPPLQGQMTLPSVSNSSCVDDTWSDPMAWSAPTPRTGHVAVWTGSEMIVWGGKDNLGYSLYTITGGRYDPATDTWLPTSTGPGVPFARQNATAVWTGTELIVWGGYGHNSYSSDGGRYNPTTDTWKPLGDLGLTVREDHTAVWTGTEMIIWGGAASQLRNDGARYSPSTDTWSPTSLGANVPAARIRHTAVWTNGKMLIWGGGVFTGGTNTGAAYNPVTDSWTPMSTGANVPAGRLDHTAVWTGTEMIVWGGNTSGGPPGLNTGGRYKPSTNSWTPVPTSGAPSARFDHTAVWSGSEMIVWGGFGTPNTGGRYSPTSNAWVTTSTVGAPIARADNSAVWTGTEMIVWGGNNGTPVVNTGGRYKPSTNSWLPTSTGSVVNQLFAGESGTWTGSELLLYASAGGFVGKWDPAVNSWTLVGTGQNLPAYRYWHVQLWSGHELLVWGGSSSNSQLGGRYDPSTDTWVPISMNGAVPPPLANAAGVWTGREMLVWGGFDLAAQQNVNVGGRYDPIADAWTAMGTGPGNPPGRQRATAVWTGSEMLVWGGAIVNGSGMTVTFDSGGRYNPGTDTWMPISMGPSKPSMRYLNAGIWTGSELLIWGGTPNGGPFYLDDGSRYDPQADTWTPIASGGSTMMARANMPTVWTGTEMLVWGGEGNPGQQVDWASGGRYDPALDAWRPTSVGAHVLGGRHGHTAVWTGSQLIAWGGLFWVLNDEVLFSGGLYCAGPCTAPNAAAQLLGTHASGVAYFTSDVTAGASGYDVVRGSIAALRQSGGNFALATTQCLANDATVPAVYDVALPATGDAFFYLSRAVACAPGTFDDGTQVGLRDAEIAASPGACRQP